MRTSTPIRPAPDFISAGEETPLVLIIEDEEDVCSAMEMKLSLEGYQTRLALNGKDGIKEVFRDPIPDLVLLDIMLPDMSGLEVCMRIRQEPLTRDMPIIMLTARGSEIDRVLGLEVGADDYLVKPYSVRELMLRIQVALRRAQIRETSPRQTTFGPLTVDMDAHRVSIADEEVVLTATEFKLLGALIERQDRILNRDILLDVVWGVQSYVQTRTVDAHIKQLRKKLGPAAGYVETIRGVGYRFNTRGTPEIP